jgi:uncharacterized protein YneF (UPF0154 family)
MQCAWVQYAEVISIALFIGFVIGFTIMMYYIKYKYINSEVIDNG